MQTKVFAAVAVLLSAFALGCGNKEYQLVRWPDGENDRHAIEIRGNRGSVVVIPDVRVLQTANQFLSGNAYWNYKDVSYSTPNGSLMTNEFRFVLDKRAPYPKCYAMISTNKELWIAWCISHKAPTNIVEIKEFVDSRTPL